MNSAVQIFQIIFFGIGSLFMITFCIIGIWSFIILKKYYKAKRIQNYILEKIYQSINQLNNNNSSIKHTNDDFLNIDPFLENE